MVRGTALAAARRGRARAKTADVRILLEEMGVGGRGVELVRVIRMKNLPFFRRSFIHPTGAISTSASQHHLLISLLRSREVFGLRNTK